MAEGRQALPNTESVLRPKAPDARAADRLDLLTGRGRHTRHGARDGRAAWERATGYGRRNAGERTFSRFKRVLGGELRWHGLDAQRVAVRIAVHALNRMTAFGLPRAQRAA